LIALLEVVRLLDAKETFGCNVEFRNPVTISLTSIENFTNFRFKIRFPHNRKISKPEMNISVVKPYEMSLLITLPCGDPVRYLLSNKEW
jgi:hypothetical protein